MANGSTSGSLQPFHPDTEGGFMMYMEWVCPFLEANEVSEAEYVPIFLSCIGSEMYRLVRNLLAPAKSMDKSLEQIIDTLKTHYEPKPLVIVEGSLGQKSNFLIFTEKGQEQDTSPACHVPKETWSVMEKIQRNFIHQGHFTCMLYTKGNMLPHFWKLQEIL